MTPIIYHDYSPCYSSFIYNRSSWQTVFLGQTAVSHISSDLILVHCKKYRAVILLLFLKRLRSDMLQSTFTRLNSIIESDWIVRVWVNVCVHLFLQVCVEVWGCVWGGVVEDERHKPKKGKEEGGEVEWRMRKQNRVNGFKGPAVVQEYQSGGSYSGGTGLQNQREMIYSRESERNRQKLKMVRYRRNKNKQSNM